ncbi:hypothetical protein BGZ97_005876 [Linnemannia gamsii]|uniref:HTH CENPB-type domain-containing protein n=1 Tax=Linnemannia gamsii TaxID=64522 RepID=A0A9P6QUS7_9FUNG|nr:hypothetical protein BGZ97_005876 [Linnemannia gamsii]
MGVFGEKHTSLTREQKRQLIHQADTHKLRPTEVCDWVQATWGLRIARVTVYSILHKQRASLMAGHKDLYQTVQNSLTGLTGSNSSTTDATGQQISTNTHASAQDCLDRNKETGRVNKYRASPNKNKNKNKDAAATTNNNGSDNSTTSTTVTATATKAASKKATETKKATAASSSSNNINTTDNSNNSKGNGKRDRSSSVASDRSSSSNSTATAQEALGEVGTRWEGQLKRVREPASVELDRAMVEFLKSPASVDSQGRRLNDAELQSHALRLAQSIPSASRMRCSFGWLRHFKRRLGVQWAADRLGRYRWIVEMDRQSSSASSSDPSTPVPSFKDTTTKVKQEQNDDDFADDVDEEYHSTNEFGETPSPKKRSRRSVSGSTTSLYSDNSILSIQSTVPQLQHQHSPQSILDSYPNLFGTLPPLHIPSTATTMGTISPLATTLDPKLTANGLSSCTTSTSAFGMSVDGKMRKVPTKEEAYEMLQSLLMYYEQDHSYIGEQQTLLLPRWIHQQRQIMQQIQENDTKMMWLRQNNLQQQQQHHVQQQATTPQSFLFPYQSLTAIQPLSTEPHHPYHRYHSSFSSSTCSTASPPALSPMSPMSPLSPESPTLSSPFSLEPVLGSLQQHNLDPFVSSAKAELAFSSTMASLEHQMLGGHPAFSS